MSMTSSILFAEENDVCMPAGISEREIQREIKKEKIKGAEKNDTWTVSATVHWLLKLIAPLLFSEISMGSFILWDYDQQLH